MLAVIGTLIVFTVSLVVIRIATVGLTMTGVSKDLAQFQALSAFTRSGFTTKESEDIANSRYIERIMWNISTWTLHRVSGIHVHDYTRLLRVVQNYVVSELQVHRGDWLADHTLQQLRLANEGVLILGIEKSNGDYLGAPRGQTRLEAGDCLILYGQQELLLDLNQRHAGMEGNVKHMMAVTRQIDIAEEEKKIETAIGPEQEYSR